MIHVERNKTVLCGFLGLLHRDDADLRPNDGSDWICWRKTGIMVLSRLIQSLVILLSHRALYLSAVFSIPCYMEVIPLIIG